jgi:hypothetical protein
MGGQVAVIIHHAVIMSMTGSEKQLVYRSISCVACTKEFGRDKYMSYSKLIIIK